MHEILYLLNGNVQFPEQQDRLQNGTLMVVIAAVAVFGIDGGGLEQTDLIVPHQCFFIDSVHGGELAYGEQPAFFVHNDLPPSLFFV